MLLTRRHARQFMQICISEPLSLLSRFGKLQMASLTTFSKLSTNSSSLHLTCANAFSLFLLSSVSLHPSENCGLWIMMWSPGCSDCICHSFGSEEAAAASSGGEKGWRSVQAWQWESEASHRSRAVAVSLFRVLCGDRIRVCRWCPSKCRNQCYTEYCAELPGDSSPSI